MRYCTAVLAIVVIGYLATSSIRKGNRSATNPQPQELTTVLRPVPAILNEDTHPPVAATEIKIKGKQGTAFEFRKAQFVNENHGWAISSHALYRTIDAGKTWEQLPQEPESDARFISFYFVDESRGWLATQKHDYKEHYGVGISSVIMTTTDGGTSWKLQATFPDEIEINDVRFLNESEGLAVGSKGLDNRPDRGELFVLGTTNGGKEWNNISGPAQAAFKNEWGVANDAGNYIRWTPSSNLLLTQGGRIIETTDHGKTWNTVVILEDERPDGSISSTGFQVAHSLKDAGVVLRSFDNGRSWQTIYRSKSVDTFFFLTKIKDRDFYAVSDKGTFLRFTLPQQDCDASSGTYPPLTVS